MDMQTSVYTMNFPLEHHNMHALLKLARPSVRPSFLNWYARDNLVPEHKIIFRWMLKIILNSEGIVRLKSFFNYTVQEAYSPPQRFPISLKGRNGRGEKRKGKSLSFLSGFNGPSPSAAALAVEPL